LYFYFLLACPWTQEVTCIRGNKHVFPYFLGEFKHILTAEENKHIQETCGTRHWNPEQSFIGHGIEAQRGQFPWIATLIKYNPGQKYPTNCGAVIISKWHAITAAHCLFDRDKKGEVKFRGVICKN
jgi:hypothetical protein